MLSFPKLRVRSHIKRALDGITLYKKFDIEDTVAIFGAPRCGSTWLLELINVKYDYLTIPRPLSVGWFPKLKKIISEDRPYCHPKSENKILEQYLYKVLSGDFQTLLGGYLDYDFGITEYLGRLKAEKLLVKINTGIRLFPWIEKRFNLRKIFLVTRHPCATISSQIQMGGRVGYDSFTLGQGVPEVEMIINEVLKMQFLEDSLIDKIKKLSYIEERLAVIWALDYLIPFKFGNSLDVLSYENLISNSEAEFSRLFKKLDQIEYLISVLDVLRRPSRTTEKREKKYLMDVDSQLTKWKKRLSKEETSRISKVLEWFEMGFSDNQYEILNNIFP